MPSGSASASPSDGGRPRGALRSAGAVGLAFGIAIAGCAVANSVHRTEEAPAAPPADAAPAPPDRIAFDHKFHLERGVECLDCHEGADKAAKAAMPNPEACLECHEEIDAKKPKERTVAAFLDGPGGAPRWSGVTAQSEDILFSHAAHAAKKVACSECHRGIESSTAVTVDLAQDMDACTTCHEQQGVRNDCAACHRVAADGIAAGTGPWWRPASHDAAWVSAHGPVVRRGAPPGPAGRCETCHEGPGFPVAGQCAPCHASTEPADHAALWKTLHGHAVRKDPGVVERRCAECHEPSACLNCHAIEPPRDHTRAWCTGRGHGLAASMDRTRCETCHRPDTCASCHEHVSPRSHTAGWGSTRSRHCNSCHMPLRSGDPGGCAACHRGTPSHLEAPRMPPDATHTVDAQCRLCHGPTLRHADNGTSCVACHR